MFRDALRMFTPFPIQAAAEPEAPAAAPEPAKADPPGEIDELKRQLTEVQKRLDKLSGR